MKYSTDKNPSLSKTVIFTNKQIPTQVSPTNQPCPENYQAQSILKKSSFETKQKSAYTKSSTLTKSQKLPTIDFNNKNSMKKPKHMLDDKPNKEYKFPASNITASTSNLLINQKLDIWSSAVKRQTEEAPVMDTDDNGSVRTIQINIDSGYKLSTFKPLKNIETDSEILI